LNEINRHTAAVWTCDALCYIDLEHVSEVEHGFDENSKLMKQHGL